MRNDIYLFKREHLKTKVIFTVIILFILLILGAILLFPIKPSVSFNLQNSKAASLDSDLEFKLSIPAKRSDIKISIAPEISGSWEFGNKLLDRHLARSIQFRPSTEYEPNTIYTVKLENVKGFTTLLNKADDMTFHFKTIKLPQVLNTSVADNSDNIAICDSIVANLDSPKISTVNYNFQTEPVSQLKISLNKDLKSYTLQPEPCFLQGTNYKLNIEQLSSSKSNQDKNENFSVSFKTKLPPKVTDYFPKGQDVFVDTNNISVTFSEDMNTTELLKNISIKPPLAGSWTVLDNKNIAFKPSERLIFNTEYLVNISTGLHDAKKGYLDAPLSLSFKTIGNVDIIKVSPRNSSNNTPLNSNISISFNQEVDKKSAEDAFSISPQVNGLFSWSSNTMLFNPTDDFSYSTNYTVSLNPGIKSIHGLDSKGKFNSTFRTKEFYKNLEIKLDYQDKSLSCEIASLKMALSYRGLNVSEDEIIGKIGFDPTPHIDGIWGDPDETFVGDINGKQNSTGYGVHATPISKAANSYRQSRAMFGMSISSLAKELLNGNPVVVWGVAGKYYSDTWKTPAGKQINAWKGEHARLVTGFQGSPDNPTEFFLNDPIAGKITWSRSQFTDNWAKFNNMAVVIY